MTETEETVKPAPDVAALEQEGEIAADYLEGLLDIADLDGDIDMDVEGDRAVVSVVGIKGGDLVGHQEIGDALFKSLAREQAMMLLHRSPIHQSVMQHLVAHDEVDVAEAQVARRHGLWGDS